MKAAKTNPNSIFSYQQLNTNYRLKLYNTYMVIINNNDLMIPKGVWKIETGIKLMPGYMEIIEQNTGDDMPFFVYTYLYTEEAQAIITLQASEDVYCAANSELVRLVSLVANFPRLMQ